MKERFIPKLRKDEEKRTDLGTVFFEGHEYDLITHFYPEHKQFRVLIRNARNDSVEYGTCVGYRDFVESTCQHKDSKFRQGFGGQVYIRFDRTGDLLGIDPRWVTPI